MLSAAAPNSDSKIETLGPFIRYCGIDLSQGLWYGTVLVVSTFPKPALAMTGGPDAREYEPIQLDTYAGYTFWRFDLTLRMGEDAPIMYTYTVTGCKPKSFYVAGVKQTTWRWAFTSCNGFSSGVPEKTREEMGGIPALWYDLLNKHQESPFLALVGGGDQIYCDPVWNIPLLQEWLKIKGRENRNQAPWNEDLDKQVQEFYLFHYLKHFNTPGFIDAFGAIPTLNILDDHDFWDGMGSYPAYLETSQMFLNLKKIAYKYYMVFQHHTTINLAVKEGYIGYQNGSYSLVKLLGPETAIAMIDARGERTVDRVLSQETWDMIFAKFDELPSTVKHLIFVTGVPLVYPRMEIADQLLGKMGSVKRSMNKGFNKFAHGVGKGVGAVFGKKAADGLYRSMEDLKKGLGKTGLMSSLLNQFGEPELMDDLVDHWTNKTHEAERLAVVERLQKLSMDRSVRVSFLAGDVHCAGVGRFYETANGKADHHMMYQIISSAIGNVAPPDAVLNALHNNAKVYKLNEETSEDMVELFKNDVDGKKLKNCKLMGRRNYCTFEGASENSLLVSIQVENKDWRQPSVPYTVNVPSM